MRIVFFGTPQFAVASLKALLDSGFTVVGVVTAPDKPAGRGLQVVKSDVKIFAEQMGLPILQPEKLKSDEFLFSLQELKPDLQVVVAFRMLPEQVWNLPDLGTYNVHASLLPNYRGAAPINWALMNGEPQSGVTIFKLKHEIDTGSIVMQDSVELGTEMNAGELHDVLMERGAQLLIKSLNQIENGTVQLKEQDVLPQHRHAPKLNKEICKIDWNRTAEEIHNHIRGLSPYPAAWTIFAHSEGNENPVKIFKSSVIENETPHAAIRLYQEKSNELWVNCGRGKIKIEELQSAGKKKMGASDFLRGFRVSDEIQLR
jgi:methionyl-tRNA formyltransferase